MSNTYPKLVQPSPNHGDAIYGIHELPVRIGTSIEVQPIGEVLKMSDFVFPVCSVKSSTCFVEVYQDS
jgi:hypothetical protein